MAAVQNLYSGIYSSYSAPGSKIGRIEIQVFRGEKSSQKKNAYSHYTNYSNSGLVPMERTLNLLSLLELLGSLSIMSLESNCLS